MELEYLDCQNPEDDKADPKDNELDQNFMSEESPRSSCDHESGHRQQDFKKDGKGCQGKKSHAPVGPGVDPETAGPPTQSFWSVRK